MPTAVSLSNAPPTATPSSEAKKPRPVSPSVGGAGKNAHRPQKKQSAEHEEGELGKDSLLADGRLGKQTLCQLSYSRAVRRSASDPRVTDTLPAALEMG